MTQNPPAGDFLLKWRGDALDVTLTLDQPRKGRAAFRTNLGRARVRRREIIAETELGRTPLARAWTDIPLEEQSPGVFRASIPLDEVGVFSGKACFFPDGSNVPEWPDGKNLHVKVESDSTRRGNSIYTVFPRQFGSFREVARRLDFIMGDMGFKIIQTLPPFPVPATYAVMGEYGSPFAATDLFSVDPAMAEFDESATPLDQFLELIDAVHARGGLFFVDLPANHTGWASALQTHHPDWFRREKDGRFHSPGAWGVTWADLVELDYSKPELRAYMADVFVFWCRKGVDGFRCDAGYMIPAETWEYIVARVREEYPDTVFMLEGLGGDLAVTDRLLSVANLDWAYSEVFQTIDRAAFEWYLPGAVARSEKFGTLVHFAETHDNDRLAAKGEVYARLRVQIAALLSWQGAWGIANGVEWYCREKIDVHMKNGLNWGASNNMVPLISRLNRLLSDHPAFSGGSHLELVTAGVGNTLAVLRTATGGDSGKLLVLANLDCENSAFVGWRDGCFPEGVAVDLVSGVRRKALQGMELEPGEVLCLEASPWIAGAKTAVRAGESAQKTPFLLAFPRDAKRTVPVPEGQRVLVSAPHGFRLDLVDPSTGMTIRSRRSAETSAGRHEASFDAPHYKGDGTQCRALDLLLTVFAPEKARRMRSRLLVPPRSGCAKIKVSAAADEVRRDPDMRTVLSNVRGAASQMRAGWGRISSQYDAVLSANPDPDVPSDRLNLWARTRCWLQREGYARELDAKCETGFFADPEGRFARWDFRVPCGMGKETAFSFTVRLAKGDNAARLDVVRIPAGDDDVGDQVRIVFRPDIEWRSFHEKTKAYIGDRETLFRSASAPLKTGCGFSFRPYDGAFEMRVENGVYHHEPQWDYNVAHPEEAARGQDGAGDLYSPGWISADLKIGDRIAMTGVFSAKGPVAEVSALAWPEDGLALGDAPAAIPLGEAFRRALDLYIVNRDGLKTVIAGYPWFLDWGRDTFIFMRGMIAAGMVDESLDILKAFAAFEDRGTLPNIIHGDRAGNRDTTDAPLWFVRCVEEILAAGGKRVSAAAKSLRATCERIVEGYIAGTPNGIRVDSGSGLVWSPAHFTWMDTNYPACTPREGYPVEIQALWISALRFLGKERLAAKATKSVMRLFKRPLKDGTAPAGCWDCLAAPAGTGAEDAVPEGCLRPNQLFLITLGVLEDASIVDAASELLVPGGMRSLSADNPHYRGVYEGDEDTCRKPAYHNGTVWAWQFPMYAEALAKTGRCSREVAMQLLASAVESANTGCLCHMSEIADGDAPHAQKGCAAQAWSDSELLRVWLALTCEPSGEGTSTT